MNVNSTILSLRNNFTITVTNTQDDLTQKALLIDNNS